jgi:hypothetical protein
MAIGVGAEEERAITTTIALTKATDMATVTEMKRKQGQWQKGNGTLTAMATATATKTHIRWRL